MFQVMVIVTRSLVLRFYSAIFKYLKYNVDLRWTLSCSKYGNTYIQAKGTSATRILYTDRHRLFALVRGRDDGLSLDDVDCCRSELTLGWSGEDGGVQHHVLLHLHKFWTI